MPKAKIYASGFSIILEENHATGDNLQCQAVKISYTTQVRSVPGPSCDKDMSNAQSLKSTGSVNFGAASWSGGNCAALLMDPGI